MMLLVKDQKDCVAQLSTLLLTAVLAVEAGATVLKSRLQPLLLCRYLF